METMTERALDMKREYVLSVLSIALTTGILLLVNLLIITFYKVDIESIRQQAALISFVDSWAIDPNPVERLQWIASIILLPFVLFASDHFVRKTAKKFQVSDDTLDIVYISTLVFGLISVLTIFMITLVKNIPTFIMYYQKLMIYDKVLLLVFLFILYPIILGCVYISHKKPIANTIAAIGFAITSGILIVTTFIIGIYNKTTVVNPQAFNPVFYSISEVINGKTLFVDYINVYGLHPHFLEPIFKAVGLTTLNYSIVMGVLTAIAFVFIYKFLKENIKNNVVSILGFTSVIFFTYMIMRLDVWDAYNQYWPIRLIFPAMLIYWSAIYIKTKSKLIYYGLFVISAISLLWNLDTGMLVFGSWILLLFFIELQDNKTVIKNSIIHTLIAIITTTLIFGLYEVAMYMRAGVIPDLKQLIVLPIFYGAYGFVQLPMEFIHPWIAIFFVYSCCLYYAIKHRHTKDGQIIFLLAILGFGLFTYYLEKPNDSVLFMPTYPLVIILTLMADRAIGGIESIDRKAYHYFALLLITLLVLSVSIASIGYNSNQIQNLTFNGIKATKLPDHTDTWENINFINSQTAVGEKIYIYANNYDGLYYGETRTVSAVNVPSYTEIFFTKDRDIITEFLINNNDTKVFVDISDRKFDSYYYNDTTVNNILGENYTIKSKSKSGQIAYMVKK